MYKPCPACLEGHCALHEQGTDPNTFDLSTVFGPPSSDLKRSVQLWRQQIAAEEDQRRQLIAEIENQQRRNRF